MLRLAASGQQTYLSSEVTATVRIDAVPARAIAMGPNAIGTYVLEVFLIDGNGNGKWKRTSASTRPIEFRRCGRVTPELL